MGNRPRGFAAGGLRHGSAFAAHTSSDFVILDSCARTLFPILAAVPVNRKPVTVMYYNGSKETIMNEDVFNTSIRKFLKTLGVSAQREIEKAVRQALADGKLKGNEKLAA